MAKSPAVGDQTQDVLPGAAKGENAHCARLDGASHKLDCGRETKMRLTFPLTLIAPLAKVLP